MNYSTVMRRLALIPVAAVLLAGCSTPNKSFIGTWTSAGLGTASLDLPAAPFMKELTKMNSLHVNADKSFDRTLVGIAMKGTYTVAGNTATFTISNFAGKDVSSSSFPPGGSVMTGTLSANGRTLTLVELSGAVPPTEYTRAGS